MVLVPASSYLYLLPEIIVALTGGLLIVADLIWPAYDSDDAPQPRRGRRTSPSPGSWSPAVAIVHLSGVHETLFNGIIQIDPLGAFFKLLFLGIGVLVILMSVNAVPKFTRWTAEFYALCCGRFWAACCSPRRPSSSRSSSRCS